jgi:hypothetical protein
VLMSLTDLDDLFERFHAGSETVAINQRPENDEPEY